MANKNIAQEVLDAAAKFVATQKGKWDHGSWEKFLADVEKKGIALSDEVRRNVGNLLESAKYFYGMNPAPSADPEATPKAKPKGKAKAAAKPKAKAKAKPKPKPKAKAKPKAKS